MQFIKMVNKFLLTIFTIYLWFSKCHHCLLMMRFEEQPTMVDSKQIVGQIEEQLEMLKNLIEENVGGIEDKERRKNLRFLMDKCKFWLELEKELEIYWKKNGNWNGIMNNKFMDFQQRSLPKFQNMLQKLIEKFKEDKNSQEFADVFREELDPIYEEFWPHFPMRLINIELTKLNENISEPKKGIPILMEIHYSLKKLNKNKEAYSSFFIEYPELAKSMHFAKNIRQMDPCQNFHKFICAGHDKNVASKLSPNLHAVTHNVLIEQKNHQLIEKKLEKLVEDSRERIAAGKNIAEEKCINKMRIFFQKCTIQSENDKSDTEKFATFKALVDGDLLGKIDVKAKQIELNNKLLEATFPFTPFFQIDRKAYVKEEMVIIHPRKALLFDGVVGDVQIAKTEKAFIKLLKILHKNGIFGVGIGEQGNKNVENSKIEIDQLIEAVVGFDKMLAEKQSKNQPSVMKWLKIFNPIPGIKWIEFLRKKWPNFKKSISPLTFVNASENYLKEIHRIIFDKNKSAEPIQIRAVLEYMRLSTFWHLIREIGDSQIPKVLKITEKNAQTCIDNYVNKYFPHCLEHFLAKDEIKNEINKMKYDKLVKITSEIFQKIKRSFIKYLEKIRWMGIVLQRKAKEKLNGFKVQIGYSAEILDGAELDRKYYQNLVISLKMSWPELLLRIRANYANWPSNSPTSVGNEVLGRYEEYTNSILINRAILQKPYLMAQFENGDKMGTSKVYNFGGIGSIIAHEMAHSLDPISIKKTAKGQLRKIYALDYIAGKPFTEKLILQKYNKKVNCLRRQYQNYWIKKECKNPKISIREDFSDNLGLQIAHETNEEEMMEALAKGNNEGIENEEEREILGLEEFTKKQLFFIAFAYKECIKFSEIGRAVWRTNMKIAHSLPSARINLPLLNLPAFSQAFQCPEGSKLNPIGKDACCDNVDLRN